MPVTAIQAAANTVIQFNPQNTRISDLKEAVNIFMSYPHAVTGEVELALLRVAKIKDPRISNVASVILSEKSLGSLPEDVRQHEAFHPNAMSWALDTLKEVLGRNAPGKERALSGFQRDYCNSNIRKGEYLIRQSATPDELDDGIQTKHFSLSFNRGAGVKHVLLKRVEDEGRVVWLVGELMFVTLSAITERYCQNLTPASRPQPYL